MRLPNVWTVPALLVTILAASGCVNPTPNPDPQPVPTPKPAKLTMSGNTAYGGVTIGLSQEATFTITNTGAGDATLDPTVVTNFGVTGVYTVTGGTCPTTAVIQANSKNNCTLTIKFTPTLEAHAFQDIVFNYTDPTMDASQDVAVPFKFTLDGFGILDCTNHPAPQCPKPAAVLSISDGVTYDFQTVTIGTAADHLFTVTNTGRADALLGDTTTTGLGLAGPFRVTGGSCVTGATVAALTGSCTLNVHFAPTDVPQTSALITLAFSSPAGSANATRAIQGAGLLDCRYHRQAQCPPQAPALSISDPTTFDFGIVTIGTAGSHSFTVTNNGDADAALATLNTNSLGLSAPFTITDGTCLTATSIAAYGGTCTINVQFTPAAEPQVNETIDLKYSGPTINGTADATRAIRGSGFLDCDNYPQPQCPPPLPHFYYSDVTANSYGNVAIGTSSDLTFTITNKGRVDGTMGAITDSALGLTAPLSISGGTCAGGTVLTAHGGSCTLTIRFSPGDTSTTTETFSIAYAGVNGFADPLTRQIFGSGILDCSATNDLFAAYLSGVSTAQAQNQTEAGNGAADGAAVAGTDGYNDGYAATYQGAYNNAYNQAYNNAYNSSYASGYNAGSNDAQACVDGSNAGSVAGAADGSANAYKDGSSNGSTDGFSAGNSAGYNDGLSLGASDGTAAGESNGSSTGYNDGYNSAYGGGESNGYNVGYSAGYTDGANACPSAASASVPLLQTATQKRTASLAAHVAATGAKLSSLKALLSSVASNSDYLDQCTQQGYGATYDQSAYQNAYNTAAHSGPDYQAGYTKGASVATSDGSNAGGAQGTTDGNSLGYSDGLAAGKTVSYNNCYASGYSSGYTNGYNGEYTTAYNDAFNNSYSSGYNNGHGNGYNDGYNGAYSNAYSNAYNNSYGSGASAGDSDGYNAGYGSGYSAGYAAGQDSCPSPAGSNAKVAILAARAQLLKSAAATKVYGSGQKWARIAKNGIVVSTQVSRPVRHGVHVNAKVQMNARWKARGLNRPKMSSLLLNVTLATPKL
ncbi:MAG: choice-of-anchor D domain-containing protein [Deltaproteobacteria bacterium]|nr:choice-of-anchor D domain-containing protein [Deltaproteobacteria bacterium]